MEDVEIFYDHFVYTLNCHLVYFMAIWYICWLFGIFFPFRLLEKSGNPDSKYTGNDNTDCTPDYNDTDTDDHEDDRFLRSFRAGEGMADRRRGSNPTTSEVTTTMPAL
jgi:hypothetical protein